MHSNFPEISWMSHRVSMAVLPIRRSAHQIPIGVVKYAAYSLQMRCSEYPAKALSTASSVCVPVEGVHPGRECPDLR
jgi:hypothetical protein